MEARLGQLFLTASGRPPTPAETTQAQEYLAARQGSVAAWEDLIWALINSKEFLFNH